jgi:hypothetical protein
MTSRMESMDRASLIVGAVLEKHGLRQHAEASLLTHRIGQWIERELPSLSTFVSVGPCKDGCVTLHCSNAIAVQECQSHVSRLMLFLRSFRTDGPEVRVTVARSAGERGCTGAKTHIQSTGS